MSTADTNIARTTQSILKGAAAKLTGRTRVQSGTTHRTGVPVRRDSLEAGTFEDGFFSIPSPGEADRLLRMMRAGEDIARKLRRRRRAGETLSARERLIATITPAAVRVYAEICKLARLCAGKVFPTYDHLAEETGLGRRSIARVLEVAEKLGVLIRQRRFKRVDEGADGPRYKQTSNVYRLVLSKVLSGFLPRWMRSAPPPDDELQREDDRQEDLQSMYDQLSRRDLVRVTMTSGPLADTLARFGAHLDQVERECHEGAEPQPISSF